MVFIEGVKTKFIDTNGLVRDATNTNQRFLIASDKVHKIDLLNNTVWIEVPGIGLDIYQVDKDMMESIIKDL